MRLVFSGFENPLELEAGEASAFEIENGALFARVAASLKSGCGRCFVNSKTFLTKNELEQLYEHIFFLKLKVLLLEKHDNSSYEHGRKMAIGLQFLEHK